MTEKPVILYAEDDETLSYVTKDILEQNDYEVIHAVNGKLGLEAFKSQDIDLCVLDVMMPIMDGYELAQEIRAIDPQIPILFLTAKSLKDDRIKGLRIGADDYITKPFSIEELILKVEVFLQRKFITGITTKKFVIGNYAFDYENLLLSTDGFEKKLTQKEGDLLKLLFAHKDNIIKRGVILKSLWGEDDYFLGRSMDVFISRLRKYLKHDERIVIENIHGVGFRLKAG